MTLPLTGAVSLTAGDTIYTLKFSAAALVLAEDALDLSVLDLPAKLRKPRLKDVRVLLACALQEHHAADFPIDPSDPHSAGIIAAGDVVGRVGMTETIAQLGVAMQAAFPKRKVDAAPQV